MPKLTADWGKTGEKWLLKGCFQGIERPHLWEKSFQGLQNVKNYREKAEKTAEIPKYYALFALMWEKYEKNHDVYGMLSGVVFLQICKSQCAGND